VRACFDLLEADPRRTQQRRTPVQPHRLPCCQGWTPCPALRQRIAAL
jgi:hypothetical protein